MIMKKDILVEFFVAYVKFNGEREAEYFTRALPMQLYVALSTGGEYALLNYLQNSWSSEISYIRTSEIREAKIGQRGQTIEFSEYRYKITPLGEILYEEKGTSGFSTVLNDLPLNPKELVTTYTIDTGTQVYALYNDGSYEHVCKGKGISVGTQESKSPFVMSPAERALWKKHMSKTGFLRFKR